MRNLRFLAACVLLAALSAFGADLMLGSTTGILGDGKQAPVLVDPGGGLLPGPVQTKAIISSVGATGTSTWVTNVRGYKTYEAAASVPSGTGSAVVTVEGNHDCLGTTGTTLGTITLTLSSTIAKNSFPSEDRYKCLRGNVSTLSGSTPTLSLTIGY